ncbi:MAG: cyclase family protein [Acidobacteriota bacterium]
MNPTILNPITGAPIDLSHPIESGMTTYPGLPAPLVGEHLSRAASGVLYAPGTTFSIGRIEMVANTGTYLDAPFHRFAEGDDIAALSLPRVAAVAGVVVDARGKGPALGPEVFADVALEDRAVLVWTGWDAHWRTPEYGAGNHPFLTRDAAERLVSGSPSLVGIDSLNIDDVRDLARPAHTLLLKAGIPIVEHLTNLESVRPGAFRFFAVPAPVRGMGSFPVRAFVLPG